MKNTIHKFFLLFLSVCLVLVMSCVCFSVGATTIGATDSSQSGSTSVTATMVAVSQPVFTVTIPTGIPIGEITRTAESSIKSTTFPVQISGITYLNGKQITVSISAPNDEFKLYNGIYSIPYYVYNGVGQNATKLQSGDVLATFTSDGAIMGRIDVDQKDIAVAGSYGGTLTFTVAVVEES